MAGIEFGFYFLGDLFMFPVFLLSEFLEFGIVLLSLSNDCYKVAIFDILLHISCNLILNFVIILVDFNQLLVFELTLIKIKRLALIVLDHLDLIQKDRVFLSLQHVEIVIELLLNFFLS